MMWCTQTAQQETQLESALKSLYEQTADTETHNITHGAVITVDTKHKCRVRQR